MHEKKTYNLWDSDNPLHADTLKLFSGLSGPLTVSMATSPPFTH